MKYDEIINLLTFDKFIKFCKENNCMPTFNGSPLPIAENRLVYMYISDMNTSLSSKYFNIPENDIKDAISNNPRINERYIESFCKNVEFLQSKSEN